MIPERDFRIVSRERCALVDTKYLLRDHLGVTHRHPQQPPLSLAYQMTWYFHERSCAPEYNAGLNPPLSLRLVGQRPKILCDIARGAVSTVRGCLEVLIP